MGEFVLDERLQRDCIELGRLRLSRLLLHRNAGVAWFILVPETEVTELVDMETEEQQQLLAEINLVSAFVHDHFAVSKLNVASIGNIVAQMHVHIIGRNEQDYCWPGVVWGTSCDDSYTADELVRIRELVTALKPPA